MKPLPTEINEVLAFVGDIYRKPEGAAVKAISNPSKALMAAAKNRVLYYFMKNALAAGALQENDEIRRLLEIGECEQAKFRRTLEFINGRIGKDNYRMLKTYKTYPYVTWDIDILVKDTYGLAAEMSKDGFEIRGKEENKRSCHQDGLLAIGLHGGISWMGSHLLDEDLQWGNPRLVRYDDIEVYIPNYEADMMTFIAHANMENFHLIIGDLLYMYAIAVEADWNVIRRQVEKYRWVKSFEKTVSIANGLHRAIYGEPGPMEAAVPKVAKVNPAFPLMYPHHYILMALSESGIKPRELAWELFFYTYRLWRIWNVKRLCYLDSYLYAPLGEEE